MTASNLNELKSDTPRRQSHKYKQGDIKKSSLPIYGASFQLIRSWKLVPKAIREMAEKMEEDSRWGVNRIKDVLKNALGAAMHLIFRSINSLALRDNQFMGELFTFESVSSAA